MTSDRARRSFSSSSSEIDSNRPSAPRVVLADGVVRFSRESFHEYLFVQDPFPRYGRLQTRRGNCCRSGIFSSETADDRQSRRGFFSVLLASSREKTTSPLQVYVTMPRTYSEHRDVYTPGDHSVDVPHFFRRLATSRIESSRYDARGDTHCRIFKNTRPALEPFNEYRRVH